MIRRLAVLLITVLCWGCGPAEVGTNKRQDSLTAFEKGLEQEQSGNSAEALKLAEQSLSGGGLSPDHLAQAYLLRSRCRSLAGDVAGAESDLELAEQGSPSDALLHWTKATLLDAKGKASEAKAEYAKAAKLDPSIKLPKK